MNDLKNVNDLQLIRMFYIINDLYLKMKDYEQSPELSDRLSRLQKKLHQLLKEVQMRGITLQRPR